MPNKPPRPCSEPGCPELITTGRHCRTHRKSSWGWSSDKDRPSAAKRGYDAGWQRFRRLYMAQHPACEDCRRAMSKEVHHLKKMKDYPRLKLDPRNCLALCRRCHNKRTRRGE